jgi:hypothetical protein
MFLSMTKVVVKMIAIILEHIVIFVLAFPARATTSHDLWRRRIILDKLVTRSLR